MACPEEGRRTGFRRIGDEAVRRRTGRGWAEWLGILDEWGATAKGHTLTAKHLAEKYDLGPWWSQAVAIRYEWERGLRKETAI